MILTNIPIYDGKILHSRWAFRAFKKDVLAIGNIIAFRAPMEVNAEGMIDLEDLLENDFIHSSDAINFVLELPNVDIFGGICFQRLFNTQVANILSEIIKHPIKMRGDDLIVYHEHNQGGITQLNGKASVSIACVRNGAALIHTGINVVAGKKAPAFAYSTNLTDEQAKEFMIKVIDMFYELTNSVFTASTKII